MSYTDVAQDEYRKFCNIVIPLIADMMHPRIVRDVGAIVAEYGIYDECEHFKMVIDVNRKVFKFVAIYNSNTAKNNHADDQLPRSQFRTPNYMLRSTVMMFNRNIGYILYTATHVLSDQYRPMKKRKILCILNQFRQNAKVVLRNFLG
jgi:hypothetical protein